MHPHSFFQAFGIGFFWAALAWWVAIFLQFCNSKVSFPAWRYGIGWALFALCAFCLSVAYGMELG